MLLPVFTIKEMDEPCWALGLGARTARQKSGIMIVNQKSKLNNLCKKKPNGCQIDAVHKVAMEWYSGCRLVVNMSLPIIGFYEAPSS